MKILGSKIMTERPSCIHGRSPAPTLQILISRCPNQDAQDSQQIACIQSWLYLSRWPPPSLFGTNKLICFPGGFLCCPKQT